ncbi:MAG TPA: TolC family protein [Acidobacteriaceae bacterium]|nr:TolC family protein [Acidobacteriaceae bacterium]
MRRACQFVLLGMVTALAHSGARAQLSFYTAIDLALRNSTQVRVAAAQVQHAEAAVMESVAAYKPSFSVGSSLGYSYGFPVGQPSVYSVSANSLAFSFSQPDYIRGARAALLASQLQLKDTRQQVILDTATDYIQLVTVNQQITALDQQNGFVGKLIEIEDKRVVGGLDSKVDLTQARLTGAQIALRRLHFLDQADMLRTQLGHLTGLGPGDIVPEPQTVPKAPDISEPAGIADNDGIKAAFASANSKRYISFGDARQNNRPTFAFGLEYNRFAEFNNYNEYYLHFQHNNFNVGVQITLPLFDATRKARARGSSAEAAQASAQAEQMRNQAGEQVLQLQKNIAELTAQERVAELQNELSQDQLDALTTQLQMGSGTPGAPAPAPKDEEGARIRERGYFVDMLQTRFQLTQARLALLRSMGKIEDWAKTGPPAAPHP